MLEVSVFGGLSTAVDGRPTPLPADARARELLAWLVVAPGRHARSTLAGRLRPDVAEDSARQTLRNAVYELRRALGESGRNAIAADREQVHLVEAHVSCDLWDFRRAVADGELEAAVHRATGELLAGMDADWILRERDAHARELAEHLRRLAERAEGEGDLRGAMNWARRRLELEPLAEDGHRALLRMLSLAGDRPGALAAASALSDRLRRELGVPLSAETRALVEDIRRGHVVATPADTDEPPPLPAPVTRTATPEGREPALDLLTGLWEEATAEGLRLVLVKGEPGIGKTTLAGALARRLRADRDAAVLYGRSDEQTLVPYQPWVEALERLLDAAPQEDLGRWLTVHDGALTRLLPARSPAAPAVAGPRERYLAFEAVRVVLEETAARHPVLLVLDDVHWADADSLVLLRHVVRTASAAPVLILLSAREAELVGGAAAAVGELRREGPLRDLTLTGLDDDAITALLASHGVPAGEGAAGRYRRRTAGNPYFVTELLRDEQERGRHARFPPPAIRDVIGRRLTRLGPPAQEALAAAAVLGTEFALESVAAATGREAFDLLEALDEAVAAGLLQAAMPVGRYAFAHALVPETILSGLSGAQAAQLHLRAAGPLLDRPGAAAAEVVAHLRAAGPLVPARQRVEWELRAAREAASSLAYAEAAAHYQAALAELGADRTEPLLALGDALDRAGDRDRARAAFAEAAQLARADGDTEALVRAALGHGGLAVVIAAPDRDTTELLDAALAAVTDRASAARLRARLAVELRYGAPGRADELSRLAIADARAATDDAALLAALNARRVALWTPAHIEERMRLSNETVQVAEEAGAFEASLQGRGWRIVDLWELGRLADVSAEVTAYEALAERIGLPHYRWYGPLWRAGLAIVEGRWSEVDALSAEARRIGRQADDPNADLFVDIQTRIRFDVQGRVEEMDVAATRQGAATSAAPEAWLPWLVHIDARLGRLDEAAGALAEYRRSGDWPPLDVNWHATCELADAAVIVGDVEAAGVLYDRLAPFADLFPVVARAVASYGCVDQHLGRLAATLGRFEEAEAHLRRAVERNRRAGTAPNVPLSLFHLAEVLVAQGRPGEARDALVEARALAEALHMAPLAEQAAAALSA